MYIVSLLGKEMVAVLCSTESFKILQNMQSTFEEFQVIRVNTVKVRSANLEPWYGYCDLFISRHDVDEFFGSQMTKVTSQLHG